MKRREFIAASAALLVSRRNIGGNLIDQPFESRAGADHLRLVFFFRCPLVVRPKCFKTAAKGFRLNFK